MPEVFEHFFRLLGTTAAERARPRPARPGLPRVLRAGDGISAARRPSGRDAATALFESIEPGAGARLRTYLDSAADAYDLSVTRFLYDTYETTAGLRDPALLRRLPQLAPLLTRTLASHVERRFTDPRLRQILGYPAVFLGGSPYDVPSLYHLMSHLDLDDGVLYPRGGFTEMIRAIERLAVAHGVVIETGAEVAQIETTPGAARSPRGRVARPPASVSPTAAASPPTSSSRQRTCTTPRRRCCRRTCRPTPRSGGRRRRRARAPCC